MNPRPVPVNSVAWAQICDASDRLAASVLDLESCKDRLHETRDPRRRARAARQLKAATQDHDSLCKALGGLLVAAELPEEIGFAANGLVIWHRTDKSGDTILSYVTASIIEPTRGY